MIQKTLWTRCSSGPLYGTCSTLLVMKCTVEVALALFGSVPSLPRESLEGIPTKVRGVSRGGYPSQGPHCLPPVFQHRPLHSLWCTSWLKRVLCCGYVEGAFSSRPLFFLQVHHHGALHGPWCTPRPIRGVVQCTFAKFRPCFSKGLLVILRNPKAFWDFYLLF